MKELLEKLNLDELLVYVVPGLLLELSILIWYRPPDGFFQHEVMVTVAAIIVAYGLAFLLAPEYHRILRLRIPSLVETISLPRRDWGRNLAPLEVLAAFRSLMKDPSAPSDGQPRKLRQLADSANQRALFAAGLAVALLALGLQFLSRFALLIMTENLGIIQPIVPKLPRIPAVALALGGVLMLLGWRRLRHRAELEWNLEAQVTRELAKRTMPVDWRVVETIVAAVPGFRTNWETFKNKWESEKDPPLYLALEELAHDIIKKSRGDAYELHKFLSVLEDLLRTGDPEVENLIGVWLLEELHYSMRHSDLRSDDFPQWLGPASRILWETGDSSMQQLAAREEHQKHRWWHLWRRRHR